MNEQMIHSSTWEEFRSSGLLWWVNRILHLFSWAIVTEIDPETQEVLKVYPARCKFRGFGEQQETEGFLALTNHISERLPTMKDDVQVE